MGVEINTHLTSLRPIRPENAADAWETQALLAFEKGRGEVTEVVEMDNKKYLRFMHPLYEVLQEKEQEIQIQHENLQQASSDTTYEYAFS